jgi:uncharacterized membrane protein
MIVKEKQILKENSRKDSKMVTGIFNDQDSAEKAFKDLRERGYSDEDISIIMSEETRNKYYNTPLNKKSSKIMEGVGKGSTIGATVGAVAGLIVAVGTSLVFPALGLVIAGPIAAGLAGAGAGGLTGGIIGALVSAGIPDENVKQYEKAIKNGHIVLGVNPRNDNDYKYFSENWQNSIAEE